VKRNAVAFYFLEVIFCRSVFWAGFEKFGQKSAPPNFACSCTYVWMI